MFRMELKDFCHFVSPKRLSSSSSLPDDEALSPGTFLFSGPSSPFTSFRHGASADPYSPTDSPTTGSTFHSSPSGSTSSSGGSIGPMMSQAAVRFSMSHTDSFSAQVDSILRGDFLTPLGAVKRLCLVCGDVASGFHYGVASCEACKAFFKRTIQGNMEYSCPAVNVCEITKRRRKACQACRFKKCLRAGMMKEGVRMDRVRGGRQKYNRRLETGLSPYRKTIHHVSCRNKVISHLLLTEPAPLAASQDESTNDSSLKTVLTLCDLLNRELLLLIGWAKQIPGFSELSLVDQMSLLQSGWMEALLVSVAWRSQVTMGTAVRQGEELVYAAVRKGEELVFAANLRLDESQCRAAGLADLFEALRHLTAKYQTLDLSPEEAVTLKAMALANSDVEPLDCPDSVQLFQDVLHEALEDYESTRLEAHLSGVEECRVGPLKNHRTGRLLMTLPLLRQTADTAVDCLQKLHRSHNVPLHKLLLEMIEAKA